jgi:membrane protein CcdC involved in cytochrome C biogenesis
MSKTFLIVLLGILVAGLVFGIIIKKRLEDDEADYNYFLGENETEH